MTIKQPQKTEHAVPSASRTKPVASLAAQHQSIRSILQIQRSAQSSAQTSAPDTSSVQRIIDSGGQPLTDPDRTLLQQRLGFDFSSVRLHTDAAAARSASRLDARAYTLGRHIVFAAGEYNPGSNDGKRLLAHELVHSAQQGFADPRGMAHNPAIDDSDSHAEAQAQQLSQNAFRSPSPSTLHQGVSQASAVGQIIQREKKKKKPKKAAFNLDQSGVGKLIISELMTLTIPGSDPEKPIVDPAQVMAILNTSSEFLDVAEKVEKKYFQDRETPGMKLSFHQKKDTGTHFKHAQNLMEIFIPELNPLSTVTQGIVHEMIHASREVEEPQGKKSHVDITRQVADDISDESSTRKGENKIMGQIQGSDAWTTNTGGIKMPVADSSKKSVTASFVSGEPKLTYQEFFIINAARANLEYALDSNIVTLANSTANGIPKTDMVGMLGTHMMEAATTEKLKHFQFGEDEIKRHETLKDKPYRDYSNSKVTDPMAREAKRNEEELTRKHSQYFYTYYEALKELNDEKKTQLGLQYLGILLLKKQISKAWEGIDNADDETRQVHLDLLKGVLGKQLKGIKL